MKKIFIFALMFGVTSLFASCEKNKEQTNTLLINKTENKKMNVIHLTKEEFLKKVMNYEQNPTQWEYLGDKPCIIDFYADWCGPCKMIAPILEELAQEYDGQIYVYKIDTEKEQELAQAFGIRSIPTLLFVPMNEQPQLVKGALPKSEFKKAIDEILLKNPIKQ